jgi:hypothetical protein
VKRENSCDFNSRLLFYNNRFLIWHIRPKQTVAILFKKKKLYKHVVCKAFTSFMQQIGTNILGVISIF